MASFVNNSLTKLVNESFCKGKCCLKLSQESPVYQYSNIFLDQLYWNIFFIATSYLSYAPYFYLILNTKMCNKQSISVIENTKRTIFSKNIKYQQNIPCYLNENII